MKKGANDPVPERIRMLRKTLGMNQTAFARALGTQPSTVSKWEAGHNRPIPDVFVRMAKLAEGADKIFFLEEAGLPPEYFDGKAMHPAIKEASVNVVSLAMSASQGAQGRTHGETRWDPDLLAWVIGMIDAGLGKRKLRLPSAKYAELVIVCYEVYHRSESRDPEIVSRLLRIA